MSLENGALRVRYETCADETLESLALYVLDEDNVAMDDGDMLIWAAGPVWLRDPNGPGLIATNDGGEPLLLQTDRDYFVNVETSQGAADTDSFTTDMWVGPHQDGYLSGAGFRSELEFVEQASESCSEG